jgi:hypothetical protein
LEAEEREKMGAEEVFEVEEEPKVIEPEKKVVFDRH